MGRKESVLKKVFSDRYLILVIILTIIGLLLRIYHLDAQSYWIDESFSINAAEAIVEHGYPLLDSGHVYSRSPLFHYLMAGSILAFGTDEIPVRMISVIFGTLFIPLIYIFTKRVVSRNVALITSILMAFFSLGIAWSRQARMYGMLQFMFYLSLLLFYLFVERRKASLAVACLVSTVLSALVHPLAFMLFLIYAIYGIYYLLRGRKLVSFVRGSISFVKRHRVIVVACAALLLLLVLWRYEMIWSTLLTGTDYLIYYTVYLKIFYSPFFYLAVVGIFLLRDWRGIFLLISFAVPMYFISYHQLFFHFRYLYVIIPIIFILSAMSVEFFLKKLAKVRYLTFLGVVFVGFVVAASGLFTFMPKDHYKLEYETPQPDFKAAYAFVNSNLEEGDIVISSYSPIAELYLGRKPDYTLDFSLSGRPNSTLGSKYLPLRDWYNNVTLIDDGEAFRDIMWMTGGFIVLDGLSERRITNELRQEIRNLTLGFRDRQNYHSSVSVYHW